MISSSANSVLYSKIDRRRLLDVLSERDLVSIEVDGALPASDILSRLSAIDLRPGEMVMLWRESRDTFGSNEPFSIIIPDSDYVDFFAWCLTYIGNFTPFTAFFRIARVSDLERFDLLDRREPLIARSVLRRMAGIAIAEAAIQTGFKNARLNSISLQSCHLTFSFAVLRGLNVGLHPAQLFDLSEAWTSVRRSTSDRPLNLDADRAMSFWLLCTSALLEDAPREAAFENWTSLLGTFINAVRKANGTANINWGEFTEVANALRAYESVKDLPRERQLRALDEIAKSFRQSDYPLPLLEAVLGYLIARLGNGTFDYLGLAGEYRTDFPCSALWFALFSMWQKDFDGLAAGTSLGRHIAFDAVRSSDFLSRPNADLASQELFMLAERKTPGVVRSRSASTLEVELLPNVASKFRNPFRRTDEDGGRYQPNVDVARLSRLLREAIYVLDQGSRNGSAPARHVSDDLFKSAQPSQGATKKPPKRKKA